MSELPFTVQEQIYIDYLYADFLVKYRPYLEPPNKICRNKGALLQIRLSGFHDQLHREFLVNFVKVLEPRIYKQDDNEMIQEQYDEVFEVIFILKGFVGIGYRLFDEIFYAKKLLDTVLKIKEIS